jgi:hypothetical protein
VGNGTTGMYGAAIDDGSPELPFNYGVNPENGNYHITGVNSDGSGSGEIYLIGASTPDQLQNIRSNDDGTTLSFDFQHQGQYPVHFDCQCHD